MNSQRLHPLGHLLFAHRLGTLPEPQAARIDSHVQECRRCSQQMRDITHDVAALALALEPAAVPPLIRESLLHSVSEIHRLYDAAAPIARTLDITKEEAHQVLDRLDSGARWRQLHKFWISELPPVHGEPALIARVPSGVRLRPAMLSTSPSDGGARVLLRRILILQGCGRDSHGNLWRAGDEREHLHLDALLAHPGPDLIALMVRALPNRAAASLPTHAAHAFLTATAEAAQMRHMESQ